MKEVKVISLGGSVIVQDSVNNNEIEDIKKVIEKNKKKYKFVIVTGGGKPARTYMDAIEKKNIKKRSYYTSAMGFSVTRLNAILIQILFENKYNGSLPDSIKEIVNLLKVHDIVICGGLRLEQRQTTDSTAAKLARALHSDLINISNVDGLYDKDPNIHKNAKYVPEISHKDFLKIANKIKYHPGQHFILDNTAAKTINKYNIKTFLIGKDANNLDNLLNNKHFIGTIIS